MQNFRRISETQTKESTLNTCSEESTLIHNLVVHSTLRLWVVSPQNVSCSRGKSHIFSESCKFSKVLGSTLYPVESSVPFVRCCWQDLKNNLLKDLLLTCSKTKSRRLLICLSSSCQWPLRFPPFTHARCHVTHFSIRWLSPPTQRQSKGETEKTKFGCFQS